MTQDELLELIDRAACEGWTELDLSNQGLTELPSEIGQLTKLQSLDLSHNHLTALPSEINQLIELHALYLDDNQLTTLPPKIGQLTNLWELELSSNRLASLPPQIGQLVTLEELGLSGNQLTALPPEIGKLTELGGLHLNGNRLITFPSQIAQLTALYALNLRGNRLTTLPPEIGQLTALTSLDLGGNGLTTLPPEIVQLTSLIYLDLRDNPDLPLPPEILENYLDAQTILRAWLDYLTGQKRPLNEVKLVLVGESEVGKTSLVNRLRYDTFDPNSEKTEGIAIHKWQIANGKSQSQPSRNKPPASRIRVNVWDFGGQEIMHATHQLFLTKRTLYVLVLDSRNSEAQNRLDYWLTLICSFGGDSPILVVGNKIDQHPLDLDRRGLLAQHPTVQAILDTSCATPSRNRSPLCLTSPTH
ncbi:MAG: GTP-binding protein [Anaerolineae bacterium]|nr:GTP-binding protein [Anaerolineae bacterium]